MKWIVFTCFLVISFTALAAEGDSHKTRHKKVNFRTLASVTNEVQKDVIRRQEGQHLRAEEQRLLNGKEEWLKTLEYMEANSFQDQK